MSETKTGVEVVLEKLGEGWSRFKKRILTAGFIAAALAGPAWVGYDAYSHAKGEEAAAATTAVPTITPAEASANMGKRVRIEMTVQGGKIFPQRALLNSESDFRSAGNFTLMVPSGSPAYGLANPEGLKGRKVFATGTVASYNNKPQLVVETLEIR